MANILKDLMLFWKPHQREKLKEIELAVDDDTSEKISRDGERVIYQCVQLMQTLECNGDSLQLTIVQMAHEVY